MFVFLPAIWRGGGQWNFLALLAHLLPVSISPVTSAHSDLALWVFLSSYMLKFFGIQTFHGNRWHLFHCASTRLIIAYALQVHRRWRSSTSRSWKIIWLSQVCINNYRKLCDFGSYVHIKHVQFVSLNFASFRHGCIRTSKERLLVVNWASGKGLIHPSYSFLVQSVGGWITGTK